MNNSIMITISSSSEFFGIRTYSRLHGSHGRFLVKKTRIFDLLAGYNKHFIDEDCGHYLECRYDALNKKLCFRIVWLNYECGNVERVNGFVQSFSVDRKAFEDVAREGDRYYLKVLWREKKRPSAIKTSTGNTLCCILEDKLKKRAFIKALRDKFEGWGDIKLYRDGTNGSLYFEENYKGLRGINGGLILSNRAVYRKGMTYTIYSYNIHT